MAGPGAAPPRLALALAAVAALVAVKYYRDAEAARQQVTGAGGSGEAVPGPRCPSRKWRLDTAAARLRGPRGLEAGTGVEVAVVGLRDPPQAAVATGCEVATSALRGPPGIGDHRG